MLIRKFVELTLLSLIASSLAWIGLDRGWLSEIENRTWDARVRLVARVAEVFPDPRVKIIAVDRASLNFFASDGTFWPWPRTMYEPVLSFLNRAHAAVIGFDIVFSEGGCYQVEQDRMFAKAIAESKVPVVSAIVSETRDPFQSESQSVNELVTRLRSMQFSSVWRQLLREGQVEHGRMFLPPYPELIEASHSFGAVNTDPDADSVFRRYPLSIAQGDLAAPSLGVALASLGLRGKDTPLPRQSVSKKGLLLRFFGPSSTYSTYPVVDVISSELQLREGSTHPLIDPKEFAGSVVLIGYTVPELRDMRPSPVSTNFPGVEMHATAVDNLLTGRVVRDVSLSYTFVIMLALTMMAVAAVLFYSSVAGSLVAAILLGAVHVSLAYRLALWDWWLPIVWPLLCITAATLSAFAVQYYLEGRAHRFIRNAFRHYVSPAVMEKLIREPGALSLGGERRELSIFFSDVAGFTTISEKLPAERLAVLLTRLLSAMTGVIQSHGGTVDKYVGDAIVAFWNAPLNQPEHAHDAVRAALDCQSCLRKLNVEFKRDFGLELQLRIGLHTGMVSVGNFGAEDRFNYTVVGDAANLASRLEGANKVFGTNVLISETTHAGVAGRISARRLGAVRVVGRSEPVAVFEPGERINNESREIFEGAQRLFESGKWQEAAELFAQLPDDPVSKAYLKRIERESPGATRDVVWNLSEK